MMEDVIEYVDIEDLDTVDRVSKPRQIKTREKSFKSISTVWNNFLSRHLLKHYNKKLDKMKENLATEKFKTDASGRLSESSTDKISKKSEAIARLEEKIKILSLEDVPKNYVSERKIKLRNGMMSNLTYNSRNAYSLGIDKMDKVFGKKEEQKEKNIDSSIDLDVAALANEDEALNENAINTILSQSEKDLSKSVQESTEHEEDAKDVVVESKSEGKPIRDEIQIVPTDVIRNNVKSVIDDKLSEVEDIKEDEIKSEVISSDEVKSVVDDAFDNVEKQENAKEINNDEVKDVIDSAFDGVSVSGELDDKEEISDVENKTLTDTDISESIDDAMSNIKVSRNNSSNAKINNFDSDGNRKEKYNYTPMTDEEIEEARKNIEYDKYEEIYRNKNVENKPIINIPDIPFDSIFTPASKDSSIIQQSSDETDNGLEEYMFVDEDDKKEDLSFDYSDATPKDLVYASDNLSSASEFKRLREQVENLKKRQAISKNRVDAAKKAQEEAAQKAEEAKRKAAESSKAYNEMLENLRQYTEALEEDCKYNDKNAEIAENDAKCNERFIKSQEEIVSKNMELVNEMNELISPQGENVRRR